MNQKGNILLFALIGLGVVLAVSVGGFFLWRQFQPPTPPSPVYEPIVPPVSKPTLPSPVLSTPSASYQSTESKVVPGANQFGINLFKKLYAVDKNMNIFISPTSLFEAFAMAYNGAAGATQAEMAKTLGIDKLNPAEVNQSSSDLTHALTVTNDANIIVSIANSLWTKKGTTPKEVFLNLNRQYFSAEVQSLDFGDPKTVDVINNWVSQKTAQKINQIISPPIPNSVYMLLINAVYFNGKWTTPFDKTLTQDASFHSFDGTGRQVPMMKQTGDFSYSETADFQAVKLPYGKTSSVGMYVFLPKGNLTNLVNKLSVPNWTGWLENFSDREGTLTLPKFKEEYSKSITDIMPTLGMSLAFTPGADFSGMASVKPLYIGKAIHKTFVDVNEEGTEAAAITALIPVAGGGNMNAPRPFVMNVNKPFLYVITDDRTQSILFVGVIQKL